MSESKLSESVGARASLDLGIGPFGFNLKGGIQSEIERSAYSTYVVVRTTCHFGRISEEEPDIADDRLPEDSIEKVNYFIKRNGDAYVSFIQRGAGYFAIYAFEFESIREKKEFDTKVGAGGIIKVLTFDVEAKAELKEIRESTSAACFFYQKMYGASTLQFPCLKDGIPILKFEHFVKKIGIERQLNFIIPTFIKGAGDYETKIRRFIDYQYRLSGSKVWNGVIAHYLCALLGARYNYKGIFKQDDGIKISG